MSAASRYEKALRELANLMDYDHAAEFGCENNCEGCQHEMLEASRIVREALADA